MSPFRQIAHTFCVPIAMGLFLIAAQLSGGFVLRDFTISSNPTK